MIKLPVWHPEKIKITQYNYEVDNDAETYVAWIKFIYIAPPGFVLDWLILMLSLKTGVSYSLLREGLSEILYEIGE